MALTLLLLVMLLDNGRRDIVVNAPAAAALAVILLISLPTFVQSDTSLAPLFDDLGGHQHPITTGNPKAQEYFSQGLILHYGFNHAEAVRSFREAQRLDPDCAMAFWGEALSLGPHINAGMSRAAVQLAWNAIRAAQAKASGATPKEQAYIGALAKRYNESPSANRSRLDQAYADVMREVAQEYRDDADAQALFAEALMITTAWDYWLPDGSPKEITEEITSVLETSMATQPEHPGTNHFYIHTVETRHPERGVKAADRMRDLVPQAGHLQHMPSHIYIQIGRYADATLANQKAVAADNVYLERHGAHGMYRISYMPHNAIYLCFTTTMEGNSTGALQAAETTRDLILEDQLYQPGYGSLTQGYALRYVAMARFGKWKKLLQETPPPEELQYPTAIWHYARGMALLRDGQMDSSKSALRELRDLAGEEPVSRMDAWGAATTRTVLQIAANMLAGEIAASEGNYDLAENHLRDAVELENELGYYEPPVWFAPARQTLGAILLEANQPAAAEKAYRRDLQEYPENGWSLYGLQQALQAQGKESEAEEVGARFAAAWSRADVELTSSRF